MSYGAEFQLFMYQWRCKQCQTAVTKVEVGLTSFGELAVFWKCPKCDHDVCVRLPIEKLIADIPAPTLTGFTKDDEKLLKEMHIADDPL